MNPFLVGITILFWGVFLVSLLLTYLTSNAEKAKGCGVVAIIFFVLGLFATIVSADQWQRLFH